MTIPRRRIIRPVAAPPPVSLRITKLRTRLEREQRLLADWMMRLKRSMTAFAKYHHRVSRIEREIRTLETRHASHD